MSGKQKIKCKESYIIIFHQVNILKVQNRLPGCLAIDSVAPAIPLRVNLIYSTKPVYFGLEALLNLKIKQNQIYIRLQWMGTRNAENI